MWSNSLSLLAEETAGLLEQLPGTWLVAVPVLILAWIGWRRLPVGVAAALFVAGLSGALVAPYSPTGGMTDEPVRFSAVLTGLAVLWYMGVRWVERGFEPTHPVIIRRHVGEHAVLICGLLVLAVSIWLPAHAPRSERLSVTACLLVLLALTLRRYLGGAGRYSAYAILVLLGGALRLWITPALLQPYEGKISFGLCLGGIVGLLGALVPVWRHWRYRRRVWQTEPERLLDLPAKHPFWLGAVQLLCVLVGLGVLLMPRMILGPAAVFLAALATLTAAHRQQSNKGGELGLALVGEGMILAAERWLPTFGHNALLGCGLAGVYLLWLSRFWQQQLHEGQAWTTAGRLIPSAHQLGCTAALGCFVLAIVAATEADCVTGWAPLVTALVLLLLCSMLIRAAAIENSIFLAFAACLVLLAATVPMQHALAGFGLAWPWPALAGCSALLLALRVGAQRGEHPSDLAYNAYIGAILPVIVWYAVSAPEAFGPEWLGLGKIITVASLLPAIVWRWRAGWRNPAATELE